MAEASGEPASVTVKQEPVEAVDLESRCDLCPLVHESVVYLRLSGWQHPTTRVASVSEGGGVLDQP